MINILFYGNCQTLALCKTLNLTPTIYKTTAVFFKDSHELTSDKLRTYDYIITQHMTRPNCLTSEKMLEGLNPTCKIVFFDSIFFPYISKTIVDKQNLSPEYLYVIMYDAYKNLVERYNITKNKFPKCAVITIADFLLINYNKQQLMTYSFCFQDSYLSNHPSKYTFHFLSNEIINLLELENTIDYNVRYFNETYENE